MIYSISTYKFLDNVEESNKCSCCSTYGRLKVVRYFNKFVVDKNTMRMYAPTKTYLYHDACFSRIFLDSHFCSQYFLDKIHALLQKNNHSTAIKMIKMKGRFNVY